MSWESDFQVSTLCNPILVVLAICRVLFYKINPVCMGFLQCRYILAFLDIIQNKTSITVLWQHTRHSVIPTSGFSISFSFSFALVSKRSRSCTTLKIALRTPSSCIPNYGKRKDRNKDKKKKKHANQKSGNKVVLCSVVELTSLSSLSVMVLSISHVMRWRAKCEA